MRFLLQHLLEDSASRFPERPAVTDDQSEATYGELEARSNQLAHLLIANGVEPGDRVGLYLDKSLDAVVGIYGVLKAGAAYVPLDPRAPVARLGYIAANCGLEWLISSGRQSGQWAGLLEAGARLTDIVAMSGEDPGGQNVKLHLAGELSTLPTSPPDVRLTDDDLAYILYTSGSTGQPKGVMLSHRNALGFVEWAIDEVSLTPEDRLSGHAPFHFDLSIFDLFAAAGAGASVSLVAAAASVFPVEVARFIGSRQISVWYSVPSILSLLTQHGNLRVGDLPSLRAVIFAGEVFPSKYLSRLMQLLPHASFHNWYGPTETNVCTAYPVAVRPDPLGADIPIGRPIANVETFVIDDAGGLAPPGTEGELMVRGATVMRGYWGDEEKTRSRLVPHPLGGAGTVYRTGDLVVEQPDGNYVFRGRRDHQIKSRGYRIELGEIETALNAHPDVRECVVVAVPDEVISNRIEAHVVVKGDLDSAALSRWCAGLIPRYMLPERFHFSDGLPKTSTGKIDRQAVARRQPHS
ncbi:MAG TPA: amino acid adenylation domain-containing protein [Acidimicrobiia bacterium]|nr:amino acid adenylation domain-containing protein [Acidimicrobiia bacterium]